MINIGRLLSFKRFKRNNGFLFQRMLNCYVHNTDSAPDDWTPSCVPASGPQVERLLSNKKCKCKRKTNKKNTKQNKNCSSVVFLFLFLITIIIITVTIPLDSLCDILISLMLSCCISQSERSFPLSVSCERR